MKKFAVLLSVLMPAVCAMPLAAGEAHVAETVREILANVAKVKAAEPDAVPMAFWDFDGTVIRGDISTGYEHDGRKAYAGMLVKAAEKGFSPVFKSAAEAEDFLADDYPRLSGKYGKWLSWPIFGQAFFGADAEKLELFCRDYADSALKRWYFTSSLAIMRSLEKAGVENYVVSGSFDIFVKAASTAAGIPRSRALGIRQRVAGGRITTQLEYPLSMNEGKVECVREVLNARPGAVAVAAFGNSYWTDGPFMRYVALNPLPGGARATAMMINGGTPPPGYKGLFRLVEQSETEAAK
jgi:phosphoserine phosphatase